MTVRDLNWPRTHDNVIEVRDFISPEQYLEEAGVRRRYVIPHSDGSFFSDGSGYSNGPEADNRHEIVERLRETLLRLENFDHALFLKDDEQRSNSNFLPYSREIEADIRDCRKALTELADDASLDRLSHWLEVFRSKADRYLSAALALSGIFTENVVEVAGKTFGGVAGTSAGVAFVLYCAGSDYEGITQAIVKLISTVTVK